MPQRVSDILQVSPLLLDEHNVYNGFITNDSMLYVDPRLLTQTSVKELKGSYKTVTTHFENVLKCVFNYIEDSNESEDKAKKKVELIKVLKFSEIPIVGLGYSIDNNPGKGIGVILAEQLLDTVVTLVEKGISNPIIFELAGVFQDKFGADRISDMILRILLSDLYLFTRRIVNDLNLPTSLTPTFICDKDEPYYNLPCCPTKVNLYPGVGFLLVPKDILTPLPFAESLKEIDIVISHNLELRRYVNNTLRRTYGYDITWKQLSYNKYILNKVIIEIPEIMNDLIDKYKNQNIKPYNFKTDSKDIFKWHDTARYYAKSYPLNIKDSSNNFFLSDVEIIEKICLHFRKLVEELGLDVAFYNEERKPKKEYIGRLILLELLECYLQHSPLKVTSLIKDQFINVYNTYSHKSYKFTLKFTSTPTIRSSYRKLVENISFNNQYSHNTLFLIAVDEGINIRDIVSQPNINNNDNVIKFFRTVLIDATSQF